LGGNPKDRTGRIKTAVSVNGTQDAVYTQIT
jgi:hypothetical protein